MKYVIALSLLLGLFRCTSSPKLDTYQPDFVSTVVDFDHYESTYQFSANIDIGADPGGQTAGIDHSFIGNYGRALQWFDVRGSEDLTGSVNVDSLLDIYHFVPAHEYIIERAQKHSMVIINEAHHISPHRLFTMSLLQDLYDQGYRHFGLETLNNNDNTYVETLNASKKVNYDSGYYTKDPRFAELLREAMKIGFTLFAYESVGNSGQGRELEQAENIARYVATNPEGKVLLHCGYGHADELNTPGSQMMAGHVAALLKIDPLTIDQTNHTERSQLKYDSPVLRKFTLSEPGILVNDQHETSSPWSIVNELHHLNLGMDIYVFHPGVKLLHGRPAYHFTETKQARKIDLSNATVSYPALLYAYSEGSDMTREIPLDVLEINEPTAILGLPTGTFKLLLKDRSGKTELASIQIGK